MEIETIIALEYAVNVSVYPKINIPINPQNIVCHFIFIILCHLISVTTEYNSILYVKCQYFELFLNSNPEAPFCWYYSL